MSHVDQQHPVPTILTYVLFLGIAAIKLHFTIPNRKYDTKSTFPPNNRKSADNTRNMITDAEQINIYRWERSRNRLSFDHTDRNRGRQRHLTYHKHFETNQESFHDYSNENFKDSVRVPKPSSNGVRKGYDCLEDMLYERNRNKNDHVEEFSRHEPKLNRGTSLSSLDDYNDSEMTEVTNILPNLEESQSFEFSDSSHTTPRSGFNNAKLQWRKRIMPNRLVMVRHGESEGNVNEIIYSNKADSDVCLTKLGWEQARTAGEALKNEVFYNRNDGKCQSVHFIVSPYVRTIETFHGLASAWCDPDVEFGHIADLEKRKIQWYDRLARYVLSYFSSIHFVNVGPGTIGSLSHLDVCICCIIS